MVHLAPHGPFPPYSWICSWHLPKTSRQLPCLLSFSVQHEAQMSELARHCSTIRTQSGHGDTSAEEGTSIGQEFDHFGEAKNHDQTKTMDSCRFLTVTCSKHLPLCLIAGWSARAHGLPKYHGQMERGQAVLQWKWRLGSKQENTWTKTKKTW